MRHLADERIPRAKRVVGWRKIDRRKRCRTPPGQYPWLVISAPPRVSCERYVETVVRATRPIVLGTGEGKGGFGFRVRKARSFFVVEDFDFDLIRRADSFLLCAFKSPRDYKLGCRLTNQSTLSQASDSAFAALWCDFVASSSELPSWVM